MFEKSKGLVITGGNFTASGGGTKARKDKYTAKLSQQGVCIIARYSLPPFLHGAHLIFRPWAFIFVWINRYPHRLRVVTEIINDPGPFRICVLYPSVISNSKRPVLSAVPIGSRSFYRIHIPKCRYLRCVSAANAHAENCACPFFQFGGARLF